MMVKQIKKHDPVKPVTCGLHADSLRFSTNNLPVGKIFAKTGWTKSEYSLAGIIKAKDGTDLVFSIAAITLWVIYASLHTGVPAHPAINIQRLIPGYLAPFQWWSLLLSVLVTAGWFALVRWRTAQHRSAIWKSLVLPASGISLNWFLLMTLCGHLLNQGQSLVPWIEKLRPALSSAPTAPCIATQQLPMAFVAALEFHGKWRVDARQDSANQSSCKILIAGVNISSGQRPSQIPKHWQLIATLQPPAERKGFTRIYQRLEFGSVE
jgi:hypothetical protein